MDVRLRKSVSPVEELTSQDKAIYSLRDELIDYDGAPIKLEGDLRPLAISPSLDVDQTTCLFPFEVKIEPNAIFPTGIRRVPCGHCEDCRRRIRNQWFFRIKQEAKSHLLNYFVTLTYDDTKIPYDEKGNPQVLRRDIQLFLKRIRKRLYPNKIRYFGIAEYGPQTHRPHYHIILFSWPVCYDIYSVVLKDWGNCDNITITQLLDEQIMYVCRYHTDKGFTPHNYEKTFTFMSRNPGIGHCYTTDPEVLHYHRADRQRSLTAPLEDGKLTSLGRYLRSKIYGEDFQTPKPENYSVEEIPLDDRYRLYYAQKAKRRAKSKGKI